MAKDRYTYGNHITVSQNELGAAIQAIMDEMRVESRMAMNDAIVELSKDAAKETRESGMYGNYNPDTNRKETLYRKNIKARTKFDDLNAYGQVYGANHQYSLTHLLENGHELWNSPIRTRSFEHWMYGEELADDESLTVFTKHLKKYGLIK